MSYFRQQRREAAERAAERRRRADSAPRLSAEVPNLETLRIEIRELRAGAPLPETTHAREIQVPHAAALFEFPCLDSSCRDGGHEVTGLILRRLRAGTDVFEGEDECLGSVGTAQCRRVLHFTATATYRPE